MKTSLLILRHFHRMGQPLARQAFGCWFAQSQYGYKLAQCSTRKEAVRHVLAYYGTRLSLLTQ